MMNRENAKHKMDTFNKIIKKKVKTESSSVMVRLITLSAMSEKYLRTDDKEKLDEILADLEKELS